jgi:hypothetical protein
VLILILTLRCWEDMKVWQRREVREADGDEPTNLIG